MKFGIATWRKEKGWTQEELAKKIEVSKVTISNWETGKSKPNYTNLQILADAFDISIEQIKL